MAWTRGVSNQAFESGVELFADDKFVEAVAAFTTAIRENPTCSIYYSWRASALERLERLPESIIDATRAIMLDPCDYNSYWQRGSMVPDDEQALRDYTTAMVLEPSQRGAIAAWRAVTLERLSRFDEAIQDYDLALESSPDNSKYLRDRAFVLDSADRYAEALEDFTKAIELEPDSPITYNNRGLSLSNLQRHERAIADYSKAIELDEKYEIAWNNRGFSNFNLARYQESLADYTRAIALDSQYSHPLNNRALLRLSLEQYEEALQDASAAIELDPEYGNAYCNRAWACLFLERVPEAMKWFAKAIECLSTAEHKPVNLIFNRVRAKRGMGLLTGAIEDATLALSMNRMHVLTCCERGLAYYELGQMAQAEADFTRARTYNPAISHRINQQLQVLPDVKRLRPVLLVAQPAL